MAADVTDVALLTAVLGAPPVYYWRAARRSRRAEYVRNFRFPPRLFERLQQKYPRPTRLPLLSAIDSKLKIANGFVYATDCQARRNAGNTAIHCATDFRDADLDGSLTGFGDWQLGDRVGIEFEIGGDGCGGGGCGCGGD